MLNKKEILTEEVLIKKYYRLSDWINKYMFIVASLLLSLLVFFTNSYSSNNFSNINYVSNDILQTIHNVNVWLNTTKFNKKSKNIKADLIVSKSYIQKDNAYLWIWIFMNKEETLYLPMNTIISNRYDINYKNLRLILKNWINKTKNNTIKPLKTTIQLSIPTLIKNYNLKCINTNFNNSLFCNLNKKIVVNKLIKQRSFELSRKAYDYLFDNLPYSKVKKCNIIKKIFNLKYNINNIKDIATKYCKTIDPTNYNNMFKIMDIYNTILGKNLFTDKLSTYPGVALTKLAQQQFIMMTDWLSYSKILINIKVVRKLIDNWYMTQNVAIITKKILSMILEKTIHNDNYLNIKKNILNLENGDKAIWEVWLNDLLPKNKLKNNNSNYLLVKNNIYSQKEIINNILNNLYKNIFIATSVNYDRNTNISTVEWYLILNFVNKNDWNKVDKKIKLKLTLANVVWDDFTIKNIKIENNKISKYINDWWYDVNTKHTLLGLKSYLEKILYSPLVLNNYWKKLKLTICEKVKNYLNWWDANCLSWVISLNIQNQEIKRWNLQISIKLNNNLIIKNVKLSPEKVIYENKLKFKLENITLNLKDINKALQSLVGWQFNRNTLGKVKDFVKKSIIYIKNKKIAKMVWMKNSDIISLTQKFKTELSANILLIRHIKLNFYNVYFSIGNNVFVWIYDYNKNKILHIWLLVQSSNNKTNLFLFKNINLSLSINNIEKLNQFKVDPLDVLKKLNPVKFQQYLNYVKKMQANK